jgi:hypothetical protein
LLHVRSTEIGVLVPEGKATPKGRPPLADHSRF